MILVDEDDLEAPFEATTSKLTVVVAGSQFQFFIEEGAEHPRALWIGDVDQTERIARRLLDACHLIRLRLSPAEIPAATKP